MNSKALANCSSFSSSSPPSIAKTEISSTSSNEKKMGNIYIVSRNGIVLSWEEIYERYPSTNGNEQEQCIPLEASALLQRLPRGAYTTCRTVKNGTHIYQFDYHVKRLAVSSASILDSVSRSGVKRDLLSETNHPHQHHRSPSRVEIQNMNIINEGWEREMALNCIRLALDEFKSLYTNGTEDQNQEFRITLLATWEQNHKDDFKSALYCHIGLLKNNSQSKHVRLLVHGHGRENARAKDSKWVTDRKQLGASDGYEEIILINNKGELLEGTQTNFYVVLNSNTIVTANEGVLFGSVRDSVLRVCRKHGIKVELRPPTLVDLQQACGVFITSTSRWVMPVHEVDLGDLLLIRSDSSNINESSDMETDHVKPAEDMSTFQYHNCPTTGRIRAWVLEDVETHSTLIYE